MPQFSKMQMTADGVQIQAQVQAGAQLVFTRVMLGNGAPPPEGQTEATELINPIYQMMIFGQRVTGKNQATLTIGTTNETLTEGILYTEIGLYARNPETGDEQLYGISRSDQYPGWIPPASAHRQELVYDINFAVSNDAVIVIEDTNSRIYVSWEEFERRLANHTQPATSVYESTGETVEESQRRQDALIAAAGQAAGATMEERHFGTPTARGYWTILEGIISGSTLTTGGEGVG